MKRSEIFDSFVKIAQERGLISNDSSESKKKLEQTGRAGSLGISDIEALYGVKPDTSKGMGYKKNIMEVAHPNSVVVSPAYDKLNGLVENNIERQNIILHTLNKTPNGLLTQHKYAEKDLVLSLVRIGNDLDNQNNDELRALADTCLQQIIENPLKKEAIGPLGIAAIVAGVAATLGAIYAHQHLPNIDRGLTENYHRLMEELDDILKDNVFLGVGHEYDEELKEDVVGLKNRLTKFMEIYENNHAALRELERPKDASDVIRIATSPKTARVQQAYKNLGAVISNMMTYINQMEKNFASKLYKSRHTKNKGFLTSLIEDAYIVGGKTSLLADDFQDVINAIATFKTSVAAIMQELQNAKSIEEKAKADLAAAQYKTQEYGIGSGFQIVPTPDQPKQSPPTMEAGLDKQTEESGVEDLDKSLKDFGITI